MKDHPLVIDNLIDWTNICANEKGRRLRI